MFIYPRLSLAYADNLLAEIRDTYKHNGLKGVEGFVRLDHPRASPVATGGRAAGPDKIASVRESVMTDLKSFLKDGDVIGRAKVASFDRALGKSLYENLAVLPGDAAHDEMWNFLTLAVFPDLAVMRFPEMHTDRMLGTHRNALRRTWFRYEVLGDLLDNVGRPLGEDELVGLFERTALARNRPLLRAVARIVAEYDGQGSRSDWARSLYTRVTYVTGPRLLDILDDDQIFDILSEAIASIPVMVHE